MAPQFRSCGCNGLSERNKERIKERAKQSKDNNKKYAKDIQILDLQEALKEAEETALKYQSIFGKE